MRGKTQQDYYVILQTNLCNLDRNSVWSYSMCCGHNSSFSLLPGIQLSVTPAVIETCKGKDSIVNHNKLRT